MGWDRNWESSRPLPELGAPPITLLRSEGFVALYDSEPEQKIRAIRHKSNPPRRAREWRRRPDRRFAGGRRQEWSMTG